MSAALKQVCDDSMVFTTEMKQPTKVASEDNETIYTLEMKLTRGDFGQREIKKSELRGGSREKSDCWSPQYIWAWPHPVGVVKISKFCQNCRKKQMNYKELFIHIFVNEQYIYRVSKIWFTATCKHKYLWQYRACALVSG